MIIPSMYTVYFEQIHPLRYIFILPLPLFQTAFGGFHYAVITHTHTHRCVAYFNPLYPSVFFPFTFPISADPLLHTVPLLHSCLIIIIIIIIVIIILGFKSLLKCL